jgi:hypothetical protein
MNEIKEYFVPGYLAKIKYIIWKSIAFPNGIANQ